MQVSTSDYTPNKFALAAIRWGFEAENFYKPDALPVAQPIASKHCICDFT